MFLCDGERAEGTGMDERGVLLFPETACSAIGNIYQTLYLNLRSNSEIVYCVLCTHLFSIFIF